MSGHKNIGRRKDIKFVKIEDLTYYLPGVDVEAMIEDLGLWVHERPQGTAISWSSAQTLVRRYMGDQDREIGAEERVLASLHDLAFTHYGQTFSRRFNPYG